MQTEVLFEHIAKRLSHELNQAKLSIYVAVAWFTRHDLFDILLEKAEQGVKVQLLISNDMINLNSGIDYASLNTGLSAMHFIGDGKKDLMHNKFCIIDENVIINGSYNWSYKAEKNHENITIISGDTRLAEHFIEQFRRIRGGYSDYQENVPSFDLSKVVRYLTIAKNFILLEELDELNLIIKRLSEYQHSDLQMIIEHIKNRAFSQAVILIDNFIKNNQQLMIYDDVNITALKLEIRYLEYQVISYDSEKAEIEKLLNDFHHQYILALDWYIKRALQLRKRIHDFNQSKYPNAEQDEQEYFGQAQTEIERDVKKLSEDEQKILKQTYRRAMQICHPDRVSDELKPQAEEISIILREAYENNDLAKVEEIFVNLQKGIFHAKSETLNQTEQLKQQLERLKQKVIDLENEIIALKESEEYQHIIAIDDWNAYFEQIKQQYIDEIDRLEQELSLC